jgi:tetratricopeptide (TPR) repeat protein
MEPYSRAFALLFDSILHEMKLGGETKWEQESVESGIECIRIARLHGFHQLLGWAQVWHGWAVAVREKRVLGVQEIVRGMTLLDQGGGRLAIPHMLALLGRAYEAAGQDKLALKAYNRGLLLGSKNSETYYEAELLRLKARLLFRRVHVDKGLRRRAIATEILRRALEVARRQRANLWVGRVSETMEQLGVPD